MDQRKPLISSKEEAQSNTSRMEAKNIVFSPVEGGKGVTPGSDTIIGCGFAGKVDKRFGAGWNAGGSILIEFGQRLWNQQFDHANPFEGNAMTTRKAAIVLLILGAIECLAAMGYMLLSV